MFRRVALAALVVVGILAGVLVPNHSPASAVASDAVPAAGELTGIDIASYQHPSGAAINWSQVAGAGHSFAYVKSTEGTTYTNPYFAADWSGAGSAGLLRGTYHYARPQVPLSTAIDQARYFVSRAGTMNGAKDLPPMLDLEDTGTGMTGAEIVQWSRTWLAEVERLTGRRPIIYTGRWYWAGHLDSNMGLKDYRLWLSDYNGQSAPTSTIPGWSWTIWQYSSSGSVPGIVGNVDVNRFCCTPANLAALAGPGTNQAAGNPFGSFDGVTRSSGNINVRGWGIDPDTTGPIKVHVYANGQFKGEVTANVTRNDVAGSYPGWGSSHGFSASFPATGDQEVCVYLINTGSGNANPRFPCQKTTGQPAGSLDSLRRVPGGVMATGWAFDPDDLGPVAVQLTVDGVTQTGTPTLNRVDVQAAFGLASPTVGYSVFVPTSAGSRQVCLGVVDQPSGVSKPSGCRTTTVDANPYGSLDTAVVDANGLRVTGWTIDPDVEASTEVHIYDNGQLLGVQQANGARPDVAAVIPGYGAAHGFDFSAPSISNGTHNICVYAINVAAGDANVIVGCRVLVVSGAPFGSADIVAIQGGQLRVAGWAIDYSAPNTAIQVRITINGVVTVVTASQSRADIGAAFGAGPNHGFDTLVPLSGGSPYAVRVEALGVGGGPATRLLATRSVT